MASFANLSAALKMVRRVRVHGRVTGTSKGVLRVSGLCAEARVGDLVRISAANGSGLGEVLNIGVSEIEVLPERGLDGHAYGDGVEWLGASAIAPDPSWLGRTVSGPQGDVAALRRRS